MMVRYPEAKESLTTLLDMLPTIFKDSSKNMSAMGAALQAAQLCLVWLFVHCLFRKIALR
jgi:hypothetical protein